jgi:hypothetical protein
MFRHPMEIEIFVEARQKEVEEMFGPQNWQSMSPKPKGGSVLSHARHLLGMAFIVTGDHIAGDTSLVDRAQAREQSSSVITA